MTKRRYPTRAAPVLRFFQFPIRQTIFALALALAPTLAVAFCQLPAAAQRSQQPRAAVIVIAESNLQSPADYD